MIPTSAFFAAFGLPPPVLEYRFHPTRRWRLDFSYPGPKVGIEVQGGIFIRGKHSRGVGLIKDYEKLNAAQLMGWIVLQFTPEQMRSGYFSIHVREALSARMPQRSKRQSGGKPSAAQHG